MLRKTSPPAWRGNGQGRHKTHRARSPPAAGPVPGRWGDLAPPRGARTLFRQVHLDPDQIDLALLLERGLRLGNLLPVAGAAVAAPGAVHLHLALTLDAGRNERQRVQPRDRDFLVATFTDAIGARLESGQRPLDLVQLARL